MSHAELSPSRLARIIACPGSVIAAREVPESATSPYAAEGTMLHNCVDAILNEVDVPATLSAEQAEVVNVAVEYARSLMPTNGLWGTEVRVKLDAFGVPEVWGTCDFHAVHTDSHLDVVDWKFGRGEQVFVKDNEQMLAYAAGLVARYQDITDPNFKVRMHIVQPRFDHIDTDVITFGRLRAWVEQVLRPTVPLIYADEPILIPGKKQCKWCPARYTCKARMSAADASAVAVFAAQADLRVNVTTMEQLVSLLEKCEMATAAAKDIKKFFFMELSKGKPVPGFKLVRGRSTRTWAHPESVVAKKLMDMGVDVDLAYKSELRTPAGIEKVAPALKKNPDFQQLITKPLGPVSLVPESDPRPEVRGELSLDSAFADYTDSEE